MPPDDWGQIYQDAGQQYGLDPNLLRSVVSTESAGNPNAVSEKGAQGPAQLMPATAKALGVDDPTDPTQAIPAGARLLRENFDRYGDPNMAIAAYHGGTDQANWGPKTQDYVRKVSNAYTQYQAPAAQPQAQPAPQNDITAKIDAARAAGYSDGDIAAYLQKNPSYGTKFDEARKAGYTDDQIYGHLGLKMAGAKAAQEALAPTPAATPTQETPAAQHGASGEWSDQPQQAATSKPEEAPSGVGGWLEVGGKGIGRELAGTPGGLVEGAANFIAPRAYNPNVTRPDIVSPSGEVLKSSPGVLGSAADTGMFKAGQELKQFGEKQIPMTPAEQASIPGQIGSGLAGVGTAIGGAVLGGPVVPAAMFGLTGAGETLEEAHAKGATPEQEQSAVNKSAAMNAAAGVLDVESVLRPIARSAPGFVDWAATRLKQAVRSGAVFTGIGEAQQWLSAQINQEFDPSSHYDPDVKRMAAEAATGLILGAVRTPHPQEEQKGNVAPQGEQTVLPPEPPGPGGPSGPDGGGANGVIIDNPPQPGARPLLTGRRPGAPDDDGGGGGPDDDGGGGGPTADNPPQSGQKPLTAGPRPGGRDGGDDGGSGGPKSGKSSQDIIDYAKQNLPTLMPEVAAQESGGTKPAPVKVADVKDTLGVTTEEAQAIAADHNENVQKTAEIDKAAEKVEPNPTEAQIEAGNYQKASVSVQGIPITIETPKGGQRTGTGPDGTPWAVQLQHSYGYIRGTEAADGDHVDTYIGPYPASKTAYVVDQIDPTTGQYDEAKAILGARNMAQATQIYDAGFSDNSGPSRRAALTEMSIPQFKDWIKNGDTKAPLNPSVGAERPAEGAVQGETIPRGTQEPTGSGQAVTEPTAEQAEIAAAKLAGVTDPNLLAAFITKEQMDRTNAQRGESEREAVPTVSRGIVARETQPAPTEEPAAPSPQLTYAETTHTKTGAPLFVAKLEGEKLPADAYRALLAEAKKLGGHFSSLDKGDAIPGFQFKDRASAQKFIREQGRTPKPEPRSAAEMTRDADQAIIGHIQEKTESFRRSGVDPTDGKKYRVGSGLYKTRLRVWEHNLEFAHEMAEAHEREAASRETDAGSTENGLLEGTARSVQPRLHEDVAEVTPSERGPAPEGQLPELRGSLQTPGDTRAGTVQVREPEQPDASRGLQQATRSDVAVPDVPPEPASSRIGSGQRGLSAQRSARAQETTPSARRDEIEIAPGIYATRTPEFDQKAGRLADAVRAILAKIAPATHVGGFDRLRVGSDEFHGGYLPQADGLAHVIAWSLASPDVVGTVRHEAIHYLRQAGLLTDKEWDTLSDAAGREGWLERHQVEQRWPELTHEQHVEEAVAEEFAGWRRSGGVIGKLPAWLRPIFRKIGQFQRQIGAAARRILGRDATPTDVFTKVESGEIGARAPGVEPGARLLRSEPAAPFYSALDREIDRLPQPKASPEQWSRIIDNLSQKGVKKEEVDWTGVKDWLADQKGSVTKADLLRHIRENNAQLEEVTHGTTREETRPDEQSQAEHGPEFTRLGHELIDVQNNILAAQRRDDGAAVRNLRSQADRLYAEQDAVHARMVEDTVARSGLSGKEPQFGQYVLPGGENYREMLLMLPERDTVTTRPVVSPDGWGDTEGGNIGIERMGDNRNDYRSGHFEEPNILAHMRMNDRTDAEGHKVLHLEEIQSDWHQQGRRRGYLGSPPDEERREAIRNSLIAEREKFVSEHKLLLGHPEQQEASRRYNEINDELVHLGLPDRNAVPNAPFKSSWPELAMKRALRYAAERGYDKLTWTTGEQQAQRYDLSKHLSRIVLEDNSSGGIGKPSLDGPFEHGIVYAYDPSGQEVIHQHVDGADRLADLIGKEGAEKIVNAKAVEGRSAGFGVRRRELSGLDLKVGGEGMKAFYDKMLPNFMNKYGKKWGAKVNNSEIPADKEGWHITPPDQTASGKWMVKSDDYNSQGLHFDTEKEAQQALAERTQMQTVHSVDITPEMRKSVMQGQPLFQRPPIDAPPEEERRYVKALTDHLTAPIKKFLSSESAQKVINGQTAHAAKDALGGFIGDVTMKVDPLALGSEAAKATAKDFANEERRIGYHLTQLDNKIKARWSPNERADMGRALDEQSVMDQALQAPYIERNEAERAQVLASNMEPKERAAEIARLAKEYAQVRAMHAPFRKDHGLGRLPEDQQALVEVLNGMSQKAWADMKSAGIVSGEGLPHYMPRYFVNVIDDKGNIARVAGGSGSPGVSALDPVGRNLRTNGPGRRKYMTPEETQEAARAKFGNSTALVSDIRALLVSLQRSERAVAGKELIKAIKEIGKKTAIDTVSDEPRPDFFTIDHPAFHEFRPAMMENDEGKIVPRVDDKGNVVMEKRPIYVSREFEGPLRSVLTKPAGALYNAMMQIKTGSVGLIMMSPMTHNMVIFGKAFPLMPGKMLTLSLYRDGHLVRTGYNYREAIRESRTPGSGRVDFPGHADVMDKLIGAGMVPINGGWMQDVLGVAQEAGAPPGRSFMAKGLGNAAGAVFGERANNKVRAAIDAAGHFWHGTLLWDRIADLQAGIAVNMRKHLIEKGLPDDAATTVAAHFANRFAGAMPREALSDIARKVANIALFSRSFTLGNLGIIKDVMTGLPSEVRAQLARDHSKIIADASKSIARREAIGAFASDLALFYGMNAVVQLGIQGIRQYLDDKNEHPLDELGRIGTDAAHGFARRWHELAARRAEHPLDWLNPFDDISSLSPLHDNEPGKQDRIFVGKDHNGRGVYVKNPFGKVGEEFKNYMTAPLSQIKAKLSPFVRPILDTIGNQDNFGRKIYNADDGSVTSDLKALGDIIGHWMVAQVPMTAIKGGYDYATGAPDADMSVAKSAVPFVTGLSVSQGSTVGPQGAVERQVYERHEQDFLNAYPSVVDAVKRGNVGEAEKILESLGSRPSEIKSTIMKIQNPMLKTGRHGYLGRDFEKYSTPQDRERYEHVTGQ